MMQCRRAIPALVPVVLAWLVLVSAAWAQDDFARRLDGARSVLDQVEAALAGERLDDGALDALRSRIEPVRANMVAVEARIAPGLREIDTRLAQLGPRPADGTPESPDAAAERDRQTRLRQSLDEAQRRARLLIVRADQLGDAIASRERELFANRTLERSRSILDPDLWHTIIVHSPREFASLRALLADWGAAVGGRLTVPNLAVLAACLAAAAAIGWPLRQRLRDIGRRYAHREVDGSRLRRSGFAMWTVAITTLAPVLSALVLYLGLRGVGMVPDDVDPFLRDVIRAVAFVALVEGLARAILAPQRPNWRLASLSDAVARYLRPYPALIATVLAVGGVLRGFNGMLGASLPFTIAVNGIAALACVIAFAFALRAVRTAHDKEEAEGDVSEAGSSLVGLFNVVAWTAIAATVMALVAGYVAFGLFLAQQVVWLCLLGAVLYILLAFIDDLFTQGFSKDGRFGRFARHAIRLNGSTVEQIGVLLSGALRLGVIVVAGLFAAAPWGIGAGDVRSWMRGALSGFTIGGLTLSPSLIAGTVAIAVVGIAATRAIQGWLDRSYLPRTRLDPGLKNSIRTSFGYAGTILVALLALSNLGLGLDKFALVAGALSVGIGFGLQSIVNNFVSGLILLAERPIKVGDQIAVGADKGDVRRISVRSTEIELADRSTLILPNSELITKPVRNFTHQNPLGRIRVDVRVKFGADADKARDVLKAIAAAHPDVLKRPEPDVQITDFAENGINMALFCFTGGPRKVARPKSDIHFEIVRRFRAEGIEFIAP